MSNKILFGSVAREKLLEGIDLVYRAASCTLGAAGRNCVYNKWTRVPIITNDGVSIAREVEPEDLGALQGANLIKQICEKTNDEVGDGTTTSIVLAHSMIEQGIKLLDNDKLVNPMQLRREMKEAADKVIAELDKMAIKVTTLEELENVATISVESPETGKTIAKAIYEAGEHGIVYVNESTDIGVSIEKVEGYQFPQGMITPYLIKDPNRMETVLNNVPVFITELQLLWTNEFSNMIKTLVEKNGYRDILIICDEIHQDVIKFAVMNQMKGNFNLSIVKKPMQKEFLEDIASIVGANAMTKDKGLVHPKAEYCGIAKKVVVKEKNTTIFVDESKQVIADEYILSLKVQEGLAEDEVTKTKLQERIAKLTGGVYMLNVGDKTEAESKYLRMKVDDAVNATKAAKEEGIISGGGMALYNVVKPLMVSGMTKGEDIIYYSCIKPLVQIVENSGGIYNEVHAQIIDNKMGFNALTLKVEPDMIKAGIIDPVKVTKSAFSNAASFAGLLLTTECLIVPSPEPLQPKGQVV
jgi:chaperonin GroEL